MMTVTNSKRKEIMRLPLDLKFGLSSTGLLVPTFAEILDAVQTDLQRRYTQKITFTPNSNFGIITMHEAFFLAKYYQQIQLGYYDAFVTTAVDSGLDRQASNASISRNLASQSETTLHIVTDGEYLIDSGTQFETDNGVVFDIEDNILSTKQTDSSWAADATAISDDYGVYTNVPAGTINIVSDPDENILSVTNPEESNGGSDREEDPELRRRIIMVTSAYPSATINGIKTALLNIPGVREVNDVQNPNGTVDKYGNPPYTVHLYVLGGAKSDILAALAKYKGYGPLFTGSESGQVTDVTGDAKTYYFDYATPVPIYVNVSLKTNANWDADSGNDEVKQLIAEYINGLDMGSNVVLTKMYPDIYSLDGVAEATITIGRSMQTLDNKDIQVDKFEAPQSTADWINVGDPYTPLLTSSKSTPNSITLTFN